MTRIISLVTDFGYKDGFIGTIKGVILNINPQVSIVDLCHDIGAQDINAANWILGNSFRFFPEETIFVCVVDPGVGSDRGIILLKASGYYFIGPDNGVFTSIINEAAVETVIKIDNPEFWLPEISQTFQARDIFAPVAAHLAKADKPLESFGTIIDLSAVKKLDSFQPIKKGSVISGEISHIDHFGNLITNIPGGWLTAKNVVVKLSILEIKGLKKSYSEAGVGEILAVIGSHGFLEISASCANAAELLGVQISDEVIIDLLDDQ